MGKKTLEERVRILEKAYKREHPPLPRTRDKCPHKKTTYKAYGADPGGKYYGEVCDECGMNTTKEEIYLR